MDFLEAAAAAGVGIGGPFGGVGQRYLDNVDRDKRAELIQSWGGNAQQQDLFNPGGGVANYGGLAEGLLASGYWKEGFPIAGQEQQHVNRTAQIGQQHGNRMSQIGAIHRNNREMAGINHDYQLAAQADMHRNRMQQITRADTLKNQSLLAAQQAEYYSPPPQAMTDKYQEYETAFNNNLANYHDAENLKMMVDKYGAKGGTTQTRAQMQSIAARLVNASFVDEAPQPSEREQRFREWFGVDTFNKAWTDSDVLGYQKASFNGAYMQTQAQLGLRLAQSRRDLESYSQLRSAFNVKTRNTFDRAQQRVMELRATLGGNITETTPLPGQGQ